MSTVEQWARRNNEHATLGETEEAGSTLPEWQDISWSSQYQSFSHAFNRSPEKHKHNLATPELTRLSTHQDTTHLMASVIGRLFQDNISHANIFMGY